MSTALDKAKLIIFAYNEFTRDYGVNTRDVCDKISVSTGGFDYKTISRWFPATVSTLEKNQKIGHVDFDKFHEMHLRELKKRLLKIVNKAGFEFVDESQNVIDILEIGSDISFLRNNKLIVRKVIREQPQKRNNDPSKYTLIFFEDSSIQRNIDFYCDYFDDNYAVDVISEHSSLIGKAIKLGPAIVLIFEDAIGQDVLHFNFSNFKKEHVLMMGTFSGLFNGVSISGKASLLKETLKPLLEKNEMIDHAEFHLLGFNSRVDAPIHITEKNFITEQRLIKNLIGVYKGRFVNPVEESFEEFILKITRNGRVSVWLKHDNNSPYINGFVRKYAGNKIVYFKFEMRDSSPNHFFSCMKFNVGKFDGNVGSPLFGVLAALDFEKTTPFVTRVTATKIDDKSETFSLEKEVAKLNVFVLSEPGGIDNLKEYLKIEKLENFFGGKERQNLTGLAQLYSKGVVNHQMKLDI